MTVGTSSLILAPNREGFGGLTVPAAGVAAALAGCAFAVAVAAAAAVLRAALVAKASCSA